MRDFWSGRRVLLTGHTGFKGAWAAAMLSRLGAEITGVALAPEGEENLWRSIADSVRIKEYLLDLADAEGVAAVCRMARPQIVLHMAAQAEVRRGYRDPRETFASNLMGTVNLLDGLRTFDGLEAILIVTSDKVYRNDGETASALKEGAVLGGQDPYSASKAAVELAVRSFAASFFQPMGVPIATARGGNVIGGGDFAADRLVPDLYRAAREGRRVALRYPRARRPWQHVLDCLGGYFRFVEYLQGNPGNPTDALNFGPVAGAEVSVAELADAFNAHFGSNARWEEALGPHNLEKATLLLDSGLAEDILGWRPKLHIDETIEWTAEWYSAYARGANVMELLKEQIDRFDAKPSRKSTRASSMNAESV